MKFYDCGRDYHSPVQIIVIVFVYIKHIAMIPHMISSLQLKSYILSIRTIALILEMIFLPIIKS